MANNKISVNEALELCNEDRQIKKDINFFNAYLPYPDDYLEQSLFYGDYSAWYANASYLEPIEEMLEKIEADKLSDIESSSTDNHTSRFTTNRATRRKSNVKAKKRVCRNAINASKNYEKRKDDSIFHTANVRGKDRRRQFWHNPKLTRARRLRREMTKFTGI